MKKQMKEIYNCPTADMITFASADIITNSPGDIIDEFIPGENEGPFVPA